MKIALIDQGPKWGGKLPTLALMKLSASYKAQGHQVVLNPANPEGIDRTHVSVIFSKDRHHALRDFGHWPNVDFGGTGVSLTKALPPEIENLRPDYDLYTAEDIFPRISNRLASKETIWQKSHEIVNAGMGFLSRGCVNTEKTCPWCVVPIKEGAIHRVSSLDDLINPRSNKIVLFDNSLATNSDALEILKEISERKLVVDICQGIDVRRLNDDLALALSKVRHWRSVHYAWDVPGMKSSVLRGIDTLSNFVTRSKHLCYVLAGFNTSFEEDMERVITLKEMGIRPYIMVYQNPDPDAADNQSKFDRARLGHLKRWVNAPKAPYKSCSFDEYTNWAKAKAKLLGGPVLQAAFDF